MMDSFFKQRFNVAKCKTLLKLTIPRIKLLRNRREIQLKQMRREIAKLIETGQEATARIRVEHIIREEKMMAAQEIVELFCELVAVRLPIIEAQRECPLDLKEAISSICFAAPRCADLPELLQVQILFAAKYGKEFVSAATELMPECGVNRQLVELLSIQAPRPDVKLKLLKEIAEEHELDWDSSASESELLKPHEDLLNGPTQFVSGSKVPLPEEKHDEMRNTTSAPTTHKHSDFDTDFDMVDFPEVPKQPLQANISNISVPEMMPFPASALSDADDQEDLNPSGEGNENLVHVWPQLAMRDKLFPDENLSPKISAGQVEDKQFVPFISPPQSSASARVGEHNPPPSIPTTRTDNVDLQDVLAAAQAAAESAERAAAAARSAASIAQLRISELVKQKSDEVSGLSVENPFHTDKSKPDVELKADFRQQISSSDSESQLASPSQKDSFKNYSTQQPIAGPLDDADHVANDLSSESNHVLGHGIGDRLPQRLPSMDDETYFSYPNLFTSQASNLNADSKSFNESK